MAYDYDQHRYRPSSQNSVVDLSSSHCYLDGVPFKISPAFLRPSQPDVPPELLNGMHLEALHEEYEYDTEEGVLAWARAREEAKAKALADARAKAVIAAAASESNSSDSSEEEDEAPDATQANTTSAPSTTTAMPAPTPAQSKPPSATVKPPWELPVSSGNTILTPTRMPTAAKVQSPLAPPRGAQVDLALFEQEGDPFDTMELQTIDDMEELRTVLGGVTVGGAAVGDGASQEALPPSGPTTGNEQMVEETPEMENCYGNITTSSAVGSALVGGSTPATNTSSSASSHVYENVVVRPSGVAAVVGNEQPGASAINNSVIPNSSGSSTTTNSNNSSNNPDSLTTATRDKTDGGFVIEPTGDGDYVQIRPDYSQSSVHFLRDPSASSFSSAADFAPIYGNIIGMTGEGVKDMEEDESSAREPPQEQYANCQAFKPVVLPPIQPRQDSLRADGAAGNAVGFNPAAQHSLPPQRQTNTKGGSGLVTGFAAGGMSQSAYVMPSSASGGVVDGQRPTSDFLAMMNHHTYSNMPSATSSSSGPKATMGSATPAFYNNMYSRYGNTGNITSHSSSPTPLVNNGERGALRSAKSNPDLSVMSQSSSPQPWNPYKPLPPTPVSELRSSSSSTESLPNDQLQQHHHHILSSCSSTAATNSNAATSSAGPPAEVDPYNSLSNDAKTFVNNLTSMGFPRSRAARAVEKFGADEREVLDHLFNVDKLVEKKFTPAQAETGLQLFKNDIRKAEQFLDLYQQFTELGFTGERIQAALVKHQLDRDKALDYLTA